MSSKVYLGDSVYVQKNSQGIVLTIVNDLRGPSNTIVLEVPVFEALIDFVINLEQKERA